MENSEQQFIAAIQRGEIEAVSKYLEEDNSLCNVMTDQGISVLLFAAYLRNQEIVELLLKYRTDLTIFEAAATGQQDIFQYQIGIQSNKLNEWSSDGFTLIGLASFFGKKDIVELLLDRKADVNIPSNNDFRVTPLHSAAAVSQYEIAQLLLQNGAKINAVQMNGVTPLHSAANNGNVEMVKLFLENGADKNLRMKDGKLAVDLARIKGFNEIVTLLT